MKVPLNVLEQAGEDGKPIAPEVGDTVTLEVEVQVNAINGDQAEVSPVMVNGQPVGEPTESAETEESQLMSAAAAADQLGAG